MTEYRRCDAVWTLEQGPLDTEALAADLMVAIGEITPIAPARYELNRRGRWREYDGRRLMVDLLTQRTQLVTIEEEKPVERGGTMVIVATGKQDRPVQAVLRWRQPWPPSPKRREQIEAAVRAGFQGLPLASFALRVADDRDGEPGDGEVAFEITGEPPDDFGPWWRDR